MAYVAVNQSDPEVDHYYNVNFAVGGGGYNRSDDVMLVQWLLHRIHKDNTTRPWKPPTADLAIDGWIGPQTVAWIRSYQAALRARGLECHVDGRVDRCPEDNARAGVTDTIYTIAWMNTWLRFDNPLVFASPVNDPDCPKKLQTALLSNTGQAGPFAGVAKPDFDR